MVDAKAPDATPPWHQTFVDRLAADLRPVRPLWPPRIRLAVWLALESAVLGVVALSGVRPDLAAQLLDWRYLVEMGALLVVGVLSAAFSLRAAVPSLEPRRAESALTLVLAVAAGLGSLAQPMHAPETLAEFIAAGGPCAVKTALLAALPWIALILALRRGAPLVPMTAGALAGGAAFVLSFAMMRLACPMDERLHLLVWHVLPVAVGAGLSTVAGLVWLRRRYSRALP